jgi:uncharacterized protein YndB with AHSA1/START domain
MKEDLGTITRCYTIRFERTSKHSQERMWRAITDPDEVSRWMDYPATIDLRRGGDYLIDFTSTDDDVLDGVITLVEPGRVLRYAWGTSMVEWTIVSDGDGCAYTFVQTGLAHRQIEDEEGLAAGWHEFLDRLEGHLEGTYIERDEQKANWNALKPAYKKMLDAVFA